MLCLHDCLDVFLDDSLDLDVFFVQKTPPWKRYVLAENHRVSMEKLSKVYEKLLKQKEVENTNLQVSTYGGMKCELYYFYSLLQSKLQGNG